MTIYSFLFYFFEVSAAVAAIAMVFSRHVFYAALFFLVCLLCVAGLYVLAWAEFVAVTQILIYAGGALVVILFGIMLTAKMGTKPLRVSHGNVVSGALISISLLSLTAYYIYAQFGNATPSGSVLKSSNTVETIGLSLMTSYMLPFEIAGILLLIALIGAAVIASHKSKSA